MFIEGDVYFRGDGHQWGAWDPHARKFVLGVCEPTPMLAEAKLLYENDGPAYGRDLEIRRVPHDDVDTVRGVK